MVGGETPPKKGLKYGFTVDVLTGQLDTKRTECEQHFDAQSDRPLVFPRLGASVSGLCKTSLVTPKPQLRNGKPAGEKVKAKDRKKKGNEEDRFRIIFRPKSRANAGKAWTR